MKKRMLLLLMIGTTLSINVVMKAMEEEEEPLLVVQKSEVKEDLQQRLSTLKARKKIILSYPRFFISDKQRTEIHQFIDDAHALHTAAMEAHENTTDYAVLNSLKEIKKHFLFLW